MSHSIRRFRIADRDRVLALSERLTVGVAPWRDEVEVATATRRWLDESTSEEFDGVALVAETDGDLLGFVSVSTTRHFSGEVDSYIGELVVAPAFEGRGVGSALVEAAQRVAIERGHRCLTLSTGAANDRAIALYRRLGFEPEDVKLTRTLPHSPGATG